MELLSHINQLLWGGPLLILLLGTHLYFTFRLHFPQLKIKQAILMSIGRNIPNDTNAIPRNDILDGKSDTSVAQKSGVSPFAALSTTLAATLGTGNIIGVSTAVALGGPGAVFWCWITGILGMATAYSECYLGVLYREKNASGQHVGGPMYILKNGLQCPSLAFFYALCTIVAAFGVGCTTQANSLAQTTSLTFGISPHLVGIVVAVLTGLVIIGGIQNISKACMRLVPILGFLYIAACLLLLCNHMKYLPISIISILRSAFGADSGLKSITGGLLGGSFLVASRYGIARGLYTNEAGIGTSAIAAASSDTDSPSFQAYVSMTAVFWDTVVMCLLSGLVIITNAYAHPDSLIGVGDTGFVSAAFADIPLIGPIFLSLSLAAFALTTLIGWSYLGEKAVEYLWGNKGISIYKLTYLVMIYVGAVIPMQLVWESTDLVNAIMVIPNVLALFFLRKQIKT